MIPEGYIPGSSTGPAPAMVSHETACMLNTGESDAHVEITVFFGDREPAGRRHLPGDGGAAAVVVVFFASALAHELGHALREGERIDGITLWLFGGVARIRGQPQSPGVEFRIAAAGPAVTVVLVVAFWLVAVAAGGLGWSDAVGGLFDYLTRINLLVLGFNLVPALPLDGGRVLRAWLWRRQRSFLAATRSAARAGQAFGGLLVAIGLLGLFTGGGLGGIWFVFLGWFLIQAAQSEAVLAQVRHALGDRRMRDLMT